MSDFENIIRDEHRSIASVLHGMRYLVDEMRLRGRQVDLKVFWAMLYYLDTFSERMHHPKEDALLFRRLRERTQEGVALLDELEREHALGGASLKSLEQALARLQEGGMKEFPSFAGGVDAFTRGYWEHMRKEEETVLPLARRALKPEDREEINAGFAGSRDPLSAERERVEFQGLFSRIVAIAPAPIGVGSALP